MRDEIIRLYQVPKEKIIVISTAPNVWLPDMLKLYSNVAEGAKSS
jgi:hypothetical protein